MDNKIVYVCFVQNNLGVLNGEELVYGLLVTQEVSKVDSWLDEQLSEASKNGFIPDEATVGFKGTTDYRLTVSKGNEQDGYDSYCLVCKSTIVE